MNFKLWIYRNNKFELLAEYVGHDDEYVNRVNMNKILEEWLFEHICINIGTH